MNKAFTQEREDPGDRCPACGTVGTPVYRATLEAHVSSEVCHRFAGSAYFCPHPTCDVAYFDPLEQRVPVSSLRAPVYPKDPDAPICPCFGLTRHDIEADIREGVVTRVKAHLERAQSDSSQCATKTADGRSCIAAVQRHFMRLRGQ